MQRFSERKRGILSGKLGQIWVETVIYTLIAFSLMGLVLAFVIPSIEETQDKGVIDQSVAIMQNIDTTIKGIGDPGNQRVLNVIINKGSITINPVTNLISFTMDSRSQYSEPGKNISIGSITVDTETKNDQYTVTLTLDYTGLYNLTYGGKKGDVTLTSSSVPYALTISNAGKDSSGKTIINMGVAG